ncbi:hypothetical protein C0J52_23568 [Blattella germanica]|nr:hypothetical protein C0J52_23568 [Blattella germanica]
MVGERKPRDPDLENMRDVEGPPDIDDVVMELRRETRSIHAAFLFDAFGKEALKQLCMLISSTRNNYKFAGWEEFGIRLGLNPMLIKCINNHFTSEDPTHYTLLAFVQRDDATLSFSESICDDTNRNNIIRPLFKPPAPLIFTGRVSDHVALASCTTLTSSKTEMEYLSAVPAIRKPKVSISKQYGRTVMLTFASDGWYTAQQVAAMFRKKRENLPRIGVVILNEQAEHVNTCPEQFITGVFNQVDYVVPIITEEYLRAVVTRTPALQSSLQCLDARWIKYIYTLMGTYYIRNGCINDKIRCIIPDAKVHLTQRHPVMAGPLFQVWVRASETEDLSHRILRSKF